MADLRGKAVDQILAQIEDELTDSKGVPLRRDLCIADRERLLDMLEMAQENLPGDLAQAQTIIQSQEKILSNARSRAEAIIKEAQAKADRMVEESAVVAMANKRAAEIMTQCENKMQEARRNTFDYVDDMLKKAEVTTAELLSDVKKIRSQVKNSIIK